MVVFSGNSITTFFSGSDFFFFLKSFLGHQTLWRSNENCRAIPRRIPRCKISWHGWDLGNLDSNLSSVPCGVTLVITSSLQTCWLCWTLICSTWLMVSRGFRVTHEPSADLDQAPQLFLFGAGVVRGVGCEPSASMSVSVLSPPVTPWARRVSIPSS